MKLPTVQAKAIHWNTYDNHTQVHNHEPKYNVIKPELFMPGQQLTFTFSPIYQPEYSKYYQMTYNEHLKWSIYHIELFTTLRYSEFCLFLELSAAGRLHYHGTIMINDIPNFYLTDLRRLKDQGTLEIDTIQDQAVWHAYCRKQEKFMKPWCTEKDVRWYINTLDISQKEPYVSNMDDD